MEAHAGKEQQSLTRGRSFHDLPLGQRALAIRYNADWQWQAVKLQHERLMAIPKISPDSLAIDAARNHLRGRADMDFFVTAIRRLLRVAELAKGSGCETDGELKAAVRLFNSRWRHVIGVRDALEHFDDWGRRANGAILPYSGGGNYTFMWVGGPVDAQQLFAAAERLCKVIYKVIEPHIPEAAAATP